MFERMSKAELRAYINGCHANKDYGSDFDVACRKFNDRYRGVADVALTREQFEAMQRYAVQHGQTWKRALSSAWETGADEREPDGVYLRQIRNTFGPSWLMKFRMPAVTA
jgi:hypothetical protein